MAKLEWNDELSIGVELIDSQHKELIRIANELINAVTLGHRGKELEKILEELREYTVFHFNAEEELMEEIRYPQRGEHANEHTRLKQSVKDFRQQLYKKETLTPEAMLEFMKGWLLDHLLSSDRELARFIREQKAKEKEPEQEAEQKQEQEKEKEKEKTPDSE